jgi:two-component system chemotaxis sensor kinase CheA
MDKEALRRRLMDTFLGELDEHAEALNRDLLAFEKAPDDRRAELIASLFRTVHSLKGAARSVNLQSVETACHRLESMLGAARDGLRPLNPEILQLLYTSADALKDSGERLRSGRGLSDGPLERLLPTLHDAALRTDDAPTPAAPAPQLTTSVAESPARTLQDRSVRVAIDKLDALVAGSGELLIARRRAARGQSEVSQLHDDLRLWRREWRQFERPLRKLLRSQPGLLPTRVVTAFDQAADRCKVLERRIELLSLRMAAENHGLERAAASLEDDILAMRMFPFSHACVGLDRVVRDLTHGSFKLIDLTVEGGDVQVGRLVLEGLRDPLLHLVRNAVDHGIESKEEREASGKPGQGTVTVSAALRGAGVEIVVADDGRGLDLAAIREHARRKKMDVPEDDREAARLIFLPGFSTARLITELSGRGIGLDVVRHRVESLHGHVDFSFQPGRGTRVVINVPLTITTIRALLVGAAGRVFALPVTNVRRLARVTASEIGSAGGREVLLSDGPPIPIVSLTDVLGIQGGPPQYAGRRAPLVILALGNTQVALVVDELMAEEEVVVKRLGPRFRRVRHVAGATILPSGRIALILNAAELAQTALGRSPGHALKSALTDARTTARRRLLVVDDSITTRSLEKSILEAAGYEVVVAVDGTDAWRLLQETGADLVVADVEMPRMNGFALCEAIRRSTRFRELPVVLVTALESDKDKARGLDVGADAYLPKSTFDQRQLLDTISHLL